jgi:hypothetical protein
MALGDTCCECKGKIKGQAFIHNKNILTERPWEFSICEPCKDKLDTPPQAKNDGVMPQDAS